jgi:hypothetical protein
VTVADEGHGDETGDTLADTVRATALAFVREQGLFRAGLPVTLG